MAHPDGVATSWLTERKASGKASCRSAVEGTTHRVDKRHRLEHGRPARENTVRSMIGALGSS